MTASFDYLVQRVRALRPGQCEVVSRHVLEPFSGGWLGEFISNGFTPADRILENVIGSSVTHRYTREGYGDTAFRRLYAELPDGVRSYVSPDRRDRLKMRPDGLYQHQLAELSAADERRIYCALHGHQWAQAYVMPPPEPIAAYRAYMDSAECAIQLIKGERCVRCRVQR